MKPREQWRIGTEHEKFAFLKDSLRRFPTMARARSGACWKACGRFGWEGVYEGDNIIALSTPSAGQYFAGARWPV